MAGCESGAVLVTGASGLIGSHVVRALLEAGYVPRGFSRHGPPPDGAADCEWVSGDVRDPEAVRAAARGCAAIVHCAALYSYARAARPQMHSINVRGTRSVLAAATAEGVERVVVTSSAATCGPVPGRPATERDRPPEWELVVPYKRSKLAAERVAAAAAETQDVVIVNPTTTVGSGDRGPTPSGRIVRDVLRRRIRGYLAGGGLNVVAARDVGEGHVLALARGRRGERYLLGGEDVPMDELFSQIASLGGVPAPRIPIPYAVALAAAGVVEAVGRLTAHEPSLMSLDEVRLSRLPMYFSSAKARRELGYAPAPIRVALSEAVTWFAQRERTRHRTWLLAGGRTARLARGA
ncbi:MAG TPA: NAD-dependent epimerase/dehydratase family protein [Solirubrobacteraceae bacterium]|nr:NAD-dependent epimerase/dehydratase family protein [Solirubrobacteraceae bacterium]